jgi:hypothetical protein
VFARLSVLRHAPELGNEPQLGKGWSHATCAARSDLQEEPKPARAYWDAGSAVYPLIYHCETPDVVVVHITAGRRVTGMAARQAAKTGRMFVATC